jgi:hypothetical protein
MRKENATNVSRTGRGGDIEAVVAAMCRHAPSAPLHKHLDFTPKILNSDSRALNLD